MNKKSVNKFSLFKKECKKWQKFFGLLDWELAFFHRKLNSLRGQCVWNSSGRVASIFLDKTWSPKASEHSIKFIAFHEICELLLGNLRDLATTSYSNHIADEAIHSVIRRLENSVFEK